MKSKVIFLTTIAIVLFLTACKYDNFDTPQSILSGSVVYNNIPVGVRSGAAELELWQYGYQLRSKIPVYIAQDGTFTAKLFDGNYKLVRLAGAPWATQTDSIDVKVSGNTVVTVPVAPFGTITGATFAYTKTDVSMTANCSVAKVGTAAITSLTLYVGVTSIIDANNNTVSTTLPAASLTDLTTPKTVKVALTNVSPTFLSARSYVYVRLGLLTAGSAERIYTQVQKIQLQ